MAAIHARGLTKEFRRYQSRPGLGGALRDLFDRQSTTLRAVDAIDLRVEPGEIVGYIGANGAGKSTTIKMFTGILVPTAGELQVNGLVPHAERERFVRTIGVVFGQRSQLWWDIAVRETFRLLQKIFRVPDRDFKPHLEELVEVLGLADLLHVPVRKLSLGQRMRCELAASLLHNPKLLFLDEPTIGLDVVVKLRIREFLLKINRRYGTTILLTTHDLADIEALCPRVVILDKGRILYDGALRALRDQYAGQRNVRLTFAAPVSGADLQAALGHLPLRLRAENELTWHAAVPDPHLPLSALLEPLLARWQVRDLGVEETSTEEIVRAMYGSGATD